jgi:hypothetical protein
MGAVPSTCVLRIAPVGPTPYETEALLNWSRFSLQRGRTDPASTLLISAKHVLRFSLWQMEGRSQNGLTFSLFKSLTQYGLLTVPLFLTQP